MHTLTPQNYRNRVAATRQGVQKLLSGASTVAPQTPCSVTLITGRAAFERQECVPSALEDVEDLDLGMSFAGMQSRLAGPAQPTISYRGA